MACVNHPFVSEVAQCADCDTPLCSDCVVTLEGRSLCGPCKDAVVRRLERGEAVDTSGRGPSPWEEKASVKSLFATWKLVLLSPSQIFSSLSLTGKGHWTFLLAACWPCLAIGSTIQSLGQFLLMGGADSGLMAVAGPVVGVVTAVFLTPLQLLIGVAFSSLVVHLFLRIFGAANAKFETTLRTLAYCQAPMALAIVPILGALVGYVWAMVTQVIALKHMHNTSYARVLLAMFLPMAIVIVFAGAAIITAVVAMRVSGQMP